MTIVSHETEEAMAKTISFGTSGWTEEEVKWLEEMAKGSDRSKFLRGLVRKEAEEKAREKRILEAVRRTQNREKRKAGKR